MTASDDDQAVAAMCALIAEVLDVTDVVADDDIFELGCTSLKAAALVAQIQRRFDERLTVTDVYEAGTARALAASLAGQRPLDVEAPVFMIHWAADDLVRAIRHRRPAVVLSYGFDDGDDWPPPVGIEALAAHYVAQMRRIRPAGPFYLAGYSLGGIIAWEMACQLGAAEVGLVCVIDALPPQARGLLLDRRTIVQRIAALPADVLVRKVRRRVRAAVVQSVALECRKAWWDRSERGRRLQLIDHRLAQYCMRPFSGRVLLIAGKPNSTLYRTPPLGQTYVELGLVTGGHRLVEVPDDHDRLALCHGALAWQVADAIESEIPTI